MEVDETFIEKTWKKESKALLGWIPILAMIRL